MRHFSFIICIVFSFIFNSQAQTTISSTVVTLDAPSDQLSFGISDDGCDITAFPNAFPGEISFNVGAMVDNADPTQGVEVTISFVGDATQPAVSFQIILTEDVSDLLVNYTTACGNNFDILYNLTWEPLTPPFIGLSRGIVTASVSTIIPASTTPEPIPTLGQWGLICLSILLMIYGVVAIRSKNQVTSRKAA